MTKTQFISALATAANLEKPQVVQVLDALSKVTKEALDSEGSCTIPGLVKLVVKDKPATPEREGINPFTKEKQVFPAKPASKKLKVTPVKALKDYVAG